MGRCHKADSSSNNIGKALYAKPHRLHAMDILNGPSSPPDHLFLISIQNLSILAQTWIDRWKFSFKK
jgi:hypothetical protein